MTVFDEVNDKPRRKLAEGKARTLSTTRKVVIPKSEVHLS